MNSYTLSLSLLLLSFDVSVVRKHRLGSDTGLSVIVTMYCMYDFCVTASEPAVC